MSSQPVANEYSFETDVVVVGGGGCGLTAAIAAGQFDLEVLVLEKQAKPLSNTARSGGMIPAAGTRLQKEAGIEEGPEDFAADILRKNGNSSDPEMTLHMAKISKDLVDWLIDDIGINLVFSDDFKYPGHKQYRMHVPPNRTGAALHEDLKRAAEKLPGVELVQDSPAVSLISNAQGEVEGVLVQRGKVQERIRAKKIILACNGFAGNPEMIDKYCPGISGAAYFGGEGNTGEGILWGKSLGAEVAYMDAFQSHASVAVPSNILITYAIIMEGGIQVNRDGNRFGDETVDYSKFALEVLKQPGGLVWDIYDERLHQLALKFEDYRGAIEVDVVRKADSLDELANEINLDSSNLAKTFENYQRSAKDNSQDSFGRTDCRLLEAPYYAVQVTGALFHTQGGLKVNKVGRVLKKDGSQIPNLYAGGGVAAGISGHGAGGYLSGNGLLTALGYGMLAGKDVASELVGADKQ